MAEGSRHNTDGRIARGERTREKILEAHSALLREGVLKPTGKLIAERAGISVRTLWLNFKDLEALVAASVVYWLGADAGLRRPVDPSLALDHRIEDYVAQRVDRLEHIAPAARSAALGEPFSPALRASRREHVVRAQRDVDEAFGAEIEAAGARAEQLRSALFVASSWPSWSTLRDDLGLERDAAAGVMRESIATLLSPR
jgi:TetR/AcrR family transcriptional regulator of autoinduction and epiphytic fitness|nr:TetR family transcriptional regulator [Aeromicrobium sp.]